MDKLGLNEIREKYLQFFEERGHLRLPSFSVVPKNDPSILLINAGMTPMKPYFTGKEQPPSKRITNCQKCIRTGDIDNVGITDRHGTYFEMLGNFSFGDYFKEEMIPWIWEFCTVVLGMDPDRLYPSVYEEDDEAFDIWEKKVGIPADRIYRFGKEDNFWEHGVGPSGPCTEVYYDRGEKYGCGSPNCAPGCSCDRFTEFWNSVFSQFDKQEDGTYLPLEQKNIDTGVGLERLASMLQDVGSIFEVDTVRSILDQVCALAGKKYKEDRQTDVSIRIITDHIRAAVMMIGDGITPSNNGRGYVLRRLLRRAIRNARHIGISGPFLQVLAEEVIRLNAQAYPELLEHELFIMQTLGSEERSFDRTLEQGNQFLASYIQQAKEAGQSSLASEDVFRLHDTYGFPVDLTKEIAREQGLGIDEEGFYELMEEQRKRAQENTRANVKTAWGGVAFPDALLTLPSTEFTGYDTLVSDAEVLSILVQSADAFDSVERIGTHEDFIFITDKTPFYASGGGQEGDFGIARGEDYVLRVETTSKNANGLYFHHGEVLEGKLEVGDSIRLEVDKENRQATARNHTATHLLHKALRKVLGNHVTQAGSEVNARHLRFDFTHFQQLTVEEIEQITLEVNNAVLENYPVTTDVMSIQEAKDQGAMALFDEKYGDAVRVISVGDYSKELCGGTHLKSSAEIGSFRIIQEASIAAGVRRIEAVTGKLANQYAAEDRGNLRVLADLLKTNATDLQVKLESLVSENRLLRREIESLQAKAAQDQNKGVEELVEKHDDFSVLVTEVHTPDANTMRELGDSLRDKLTPAVVFLAREGEGSLQFLAMASEEAVKAGVHCGNIIKAAAQVAGGGGGGRPNMAQAGGRQVEKLGEALAQAKKLILEQLG